jgi:ABC-type phosphate transport system substrate-binding protein
MTFIARRALFALLVLSMLLLPAAAQDENGVLVVGSAVAGQAFEVVAANESFTTDFSGTQNGLSQFCGNAADIALANRPISLAEASACTANGVEFIELLIGFDGFALVASPDTTFVECLSTANLDALIAPSLTGSEIDWTLVNAEYPATAIEFVHPGANSRPAVLLDRIVRGEGFRSDATAVADSAAVIADVASGEGKLGVVSLSDALNAEGVNVLALNNATLNTCVDASAENAFSRQYQGGDRVFAYVNAAALDKAGVTDALNALTSPESSEALAAAGFVPLNESLLAQAAAVVADGTTGRVFSNDVNTFQITGDPTGTLRVGGDAAGVNFLKSALPAVTQTYSMITLEESYTGGTAAVREFCNGNRDVIALSREFSAEELAACDANTIETFELAVGAQAAVLVANAASDYLSCLSTAAIAEVFAAGDEVATSWNGFNAEFPDEPIYLFVSSKGDVAVDTMMIVATGISTPVREDVQVNADAAYRAAAVSNTPGAVAVMTWAEAQESIAANDSLQLVGVQAEGGECVAPSAENIADGSYPLAQPVRLVINTRSLETDTVQAAIYTLFADENYQLIDAAGLTGIRFADLVNVRSSLVDAFRAADAVEAERFAAETAAQETPEATDGTPEATAEGSEAEETPASDVTAEPSAEATTEETPEASATPGA